MRSTLLAFGLCASAAASESPAPAPDPATISSDVLPEGAHRALVVRACAQCHAIELVVIRKRSADEWDRQIAKMMNYGAVASETEQDQIFDYLITHFLDDTPAPASPPPASAAPVGPAPPVSAAP